MFSLAMKVLSASGCRCSVGEKGGDIVLPRFCQLLQLLEAETPLEHAVWIAIPHNGTDFVLI